MEGWILLHRKLQESQIWTMNQPFDMRSAWVDLLMLVNHEDVEMVFDYQPITIHRGQHLTSVRKLSQRWCWSKDRTLKYLRLLESLQMIHRESTNKRTLITIENYDNYQCKQDTERTQTRTQDGHKTDADPDTGSPQTNNDKRMIKNEKNEKKNIYGEYHHVRLTESEWNKLCDEYGSIETHEAIKFLDEYIEMKGYKAKSHYLAMRKWVFDAVKEDKNKRKPQTTNFVNDWMNA